jgi:RNA polymerase sigma-70 factor (ECF subfamily)
VDNRPDQELVNAIRGGDTAAYATLVRRHSAHIFAVCLGILGNVDDSEDLAQETLVKAFKKIQSLRGGQQFSAWARQIARNLCRDFLRSRKLHRKLLADNREKIVRTPADYPELREALASLPEIHRLPLMLYYFDGQKTDSIAEALNLSRAGACTRLCRARNALRERLEDR